MNQSEVMKAILYSYPQWKIDSIHYLGEGDFCWAYLVNQEWVFRFGKHQAARQSLRREYCLLPGLAEQFTLRIPSPQIVGLDKQGELIFTAYLMLSGSSLSQERYLGLDLSSRTRCAHQVATFLTQLHGIELPQARACGVPSIDYAEQYAGLGLQVRAELYPALDQPERLFIERVIGDYLESGDAVAYQPVLLHGDLSPEHVLCNEAANSVTAIIDFGDMMIGDPAWDLIFLYEDYGLDFLSRFLDVYSKADRNALLNRVYQFYRLAAIDWAVGGRALGNSEYAEALAQLITLRQQEDVQRKELFSACGIA